MKSIVSSVSPRRISLRDSARKRNSKTIRYFRSVLERLEERTLLSGEKIPPLVFLERPVSDDPNNPDIMPTTAIEVRARATDANRGDSSIRHDGFRFEFRERLSATTWTDWTTFEGFQSEVTAGPGPQEVTATKMFQAVPNRVYAFRVTATDGADNQGLSEVHYARSTLDDDVDIIIVINNSG